MFELTPKRTPTAIARTLVLVGVASTVLPGCQSIDYRQVAYEALRHEDCRRNEVDTFCTRSYSREYHEYERLRNEFLHDAKAPTGTAASWTNSTPLSLGS